MYNCNDHKICGSNGCKKYYGEDVENPFGIEPKCCAECNPSSGCFPAGARISLESGESLTMSQLQTGNRVQTGMEKSYFHLHFILFLCYFQI